MSNELRYKPFCGCDLCIMIGKRRQGLNGNAEPFKHGINAVVVPGITLSAATVANIAIDEMLNFRPKNF